ncbi:lysoplasmalogenase [Streptomyces sp. AJS327]|uniref:lysoplasmalogenase family protein n=1 Tax=Streptomyces sp. AJS327 TaxID=2545265 RepID=UPI0015DEB882|nr:lysoplasmalogenase family protein [Streptomyces sp. AJS327]MBA0051270.1 lysoplasmalogenase [Streptomyces sp. AJS327]
MPVPLVVFAVLAAADLTAVMADWPVLEWCAKPLLAPVLALHLWRTTGRRHPHVLAGLGFATAGDVALLLPGAVAFVVGLLFFLGAQLCWITAFVRAGAVGHLRARRPLCAAYLLAWVVACAALAPALGPALGTAVTGYALALLTMALTAHVLGTAAAWGGLVFVVSDLLIGLGVAGLGFPGRGALVMLTYCAALALLTLAFSGVRTPPPDRTGTAHPAGA